MKFQTMGTLKYSLIMLTSSLDRKRLTAEALAETESLTTEKHAMTQLSESSLDANLIAQAHLKISNASLLILDSPLIASRNDECWELLVVTTLLRLVKSVTMST